MIKFTHLNLHTEYSIIDGIIKIKELIFLYKKLGIDTVCITDILTIASFPEYYNFCLKKNFKPIIGIECFLLFNENIINIILISKNYFGYLNLINIITNSWRYGNIDNGVFIKINWLKNFYKNIIIIINLRYYLIKKKQNNSLNFIIKEIFKTFGNNTYLEICRINLSLEEYINNKIFFFSNLFNIKLVATNSVKFLFNYDFTTSLGKIFLCQNKDFDDELYFDYSENQFVKNQNEMIKIFDDKIIAIKNINEIIKQCNLIFNIYKFNLPSIKLKNYKIRCKIFDNLIKSGLLNRIGKKKKNIYIYINRINKEILLTKKLGLIDYYLIIAEFIFWTKKTSIISGPGRGSGASSLICYSLYITDIDPVNENLLFERFFSSERTNIPDLDLDFCVLERDNVVDHIFNYYGYNSIAQIITFHTVSTKSSIRDLSRSLGVDYLSGDRFAKSIPFNLDLSMENIFRNNINVRRFIFSSQKGYEIWNLASNLEGVAKTISKHAGGIVITNNNLNNYTPILFDEEDCMTHYEKIILQDIGLVKFDFLGLKTLSIINFVLKMIPEKNSGEFPIDDEHTFQMINNLDTELVFQLESYGMKKLISKLYIENIFDLINLLSLFRPGPIQSGFVNDFINRKHNLIKTYYPYIFCNYLHSKIILSNTHGVLLFQEQILQLISVYSGVSGYDAEKIYNAMISKSKIKLLISKKKFIKKSLFFNIKKKEISFFFDLIERFSSYSFNKTHAHSYAKIVYQTAYLKANYLLEYCLSNIYIDQLLNIDIDYVINIIKNIGIYFYKPDINISDENFKIYKKGFIYGFSIVTFIDNNFIDKIIYYRNKLFFYNNFEIFCKIFSIFKLKKKKIIENLIFCGFFDCFKINRIYCFVNFQFIFENIISLSKEYNRSILFKFVKYIDFTKLKKIKKRICNILTSNLLKIEKKILKFFTTINPLNFFFLKLLGQKLFFTFKKKNFLMLIIGYIKYKKDKKIKKVIITQENLRLKFFRFSIKTLLPGNKTNVIFYIKNFLVIKYYRIHRFLNSIGSILILKINNFNPIYIYYIIKKLLTINNFTGSKIFFFYNKKLFNIKICIKLNEKNINFLRYINIKNFSILNTCK